MSDRTVILNRNNRASEIGNDPLYSDRKETVVVLVRDGKESGARDVAERLSDTPAREKQAAAEELILYSAHGSKIEREGPAWSGISVCCSLH